MKKLKVKCSIESVLQNPLYTIQMIKTNLHHKKKDLMEKDEVNDSGLLLLLL